jgi:hypothetical protein
VGEEWGGDIERGRGMGKRGREREAERRRVRGYERQKERGEGPDFLRKASMKLKGKKTMNYNAAGHEHTQE